MASPSKESVRLDKYLWAVRAYKTRSAAANACRRGQVRIGGKTAKPSHSIRVGTTIDFRQGPLQKSVEVIELLEKRVGARLVPEYCIDLTPEEEYDKARKIRQENRLNHVFEMPGQGRPTRRQREAMRRFRDAADEGHAKRGD